ncbi:hypothetical protein GCM10023191_067870 [Actinoallomurus oryzae]|uniref:Peptidase S53 domain-containing protein n=1 Tax=Actinoallomurus oryzae TaxID=502180 RepID=A0ABP8QSY8_9ACTN
MRNLHVRLGVILAAAASVVLTGVGTANAKPPADPAPPKTATAAPARHAARHFKPAPCNTPAKKKRSKRPTASCDAMVGATSDDKIAAATDGPAEGALGPADIKAAYNLPDGGAGATVAIVDAYGDTHAESDLAVFRAHYGLPPCTTANGCFRKVDQNGGTSYPADEEGWITETSLDLDAVSAACPRCHILLVQGDNSDVDSLGAAVDTAVRLGAKYVSNSFGVSGEFPGEAAYGEHWDHPGVVVTASSGDLGNVSNWPATSPNVVSVGGTTLNRDASTPRGYTETAWGQGGSGCSPYEPKPAYQQTVATACDRRASADVSAVADSNAGFAIYDSLSAYPGWRQVGGTSLAAPLIAGMYALAGTPLPGTYPVTYLYDQTKASAFHDITTGSNGSCGDVLCTAGKGWDGPTGLGTPDGVAALTGVPRGDIAGAVTSGGRPVAGATVATSDGYSTRTDANGRYDLNVAAGRHEVTASMFGHTTARSTVRVRSGRRVTANFRLRKPASNVVSGTAVDGSGHGWPMYAKITVDGAPGATYTDPYTGRYTLDLPRDADYTLRMHPVSLSGYQDAVLPVHVGTTGVRQDVRFTVNPLDCTARGYAPGVSGLEEKFTGWDAAKDGWSVTDGNGSGSTWGFDRDGDFLPPTSRSDGDMVAVDSLSASPDTTLVSPSVDLSGQSAPEIGFDTQYYLFPGSSDAQTGDVDLSLDGGRTWENVWHRDGSQRLGGQFDVPIPQAAGRPDVRVRFHYTGVQGKGLWWTLDDIVIGTRTCTATPGGLVAGVVQDGTMRRPLNGATVVSADAPADTLVSAATSDDPNLPDGFYTGFAPLTGRHPFTATSGHYTSADASVDVTANGLTRRDWTLTAGHLTVTTPSIRVTQRLGESSTARVTVRNDGTEPVHATLGTQGGGFTPMAGTTSGSGAPLQEVKGHYVLGPMSRMSPHSTSPRLRQATPQSGPWTDLPDYPVTTFNNAVAYDDTTGRVYSLGGWSGNGAAGSTAVVSKAGYVYDPAARSWHRIADMPQAVEAPAAAFVNGTLYVVGGWDHNVMDVGSVFAYHPSSDTWTQVADYPQALGAARAVSLGGRLYVIGGLVAGTGSTVPAVYRYDPAHDRWTELADYPVSMAGAACAALGGRIVCAGGRTDGTGIRSTYLYDPDADAWTRGADMPYDNWGMTYSGANGRLQVAAGIAGAGDVATNRAAEYDPATDAWTALPNANNASYNPAGGSGCGLFRIGGGVYDGSITPTRWTETLPGYDQCGDGFHLSWAKVSKDALDLAPGRSATVTVTVSSAGFAQPGSVTGAFAVRTDTPYAVPPVPIAVQVDPPKSWGKLAGTVTDASTGKPIAGATVQLCAGYDTQTGDCGGATFTLKTGTDGRYQTWLDQANNPLEVIAAKDSYQQQLRITEIRAGTTTTLDFQLQP